MQLQITEANALQAYKGANDEVKSMLENLFGKEVFNRKITDRVKTWEDVLTLSDTTPQAFEATCDGLTSDEIGYRKYKLLTAVLNEGWMPDFANSNETKYWPWMKYTAGSGFAFCVYDNGFTYSFVGSRLVFKSRALAEYAAKQFPEIINQFFL